jgi:localization factor PodJL
LRSAKETKDTQVGVPDIIAMFGQQLDGLAAKIDMLANRTPDDTATQVLTARIEQLSQKVEAQPRALSSRFDELTARLSDQLQDFSEAHISDDGAAKRMASHLEALSSRLDQNSEALASQLEARLEAKLETKLEELAARLGSGPITLAAQLDTLAQRLDSSPSELIDRINVLTSQMAASPQDIMARLDELSSRIDTRNDTRPDVLIERIDALSSRLEQTSHTEHHSHDVISRLDELASRIDTRPDDLIARIEQLSARLDSGASAPSPQGDPELHGLLKALVHKIDDTQKPDVGSGALDALEHQIRMIADKLDHAPVAASAIVAPDAFRSLEMSMQDLAQRIDGLRSETLAASEYAAEQAAQRALEGHKTSSAETDPETARALSVVHDTLDKVMGRLSQLETGLHTKASSVSSPPTLTDKSFGFGIPASREKAPEALTLPEEPKEPAASQEQTSSQYKSSSEHYTDTARDELGRDDNIQSLDLADPDTPLDPAHSRQLSARRLVSDDTHARASMDVHAAINRSPDPQDVKASFIAAARRAAQAAAAEINTEDLKGSNKPTSAVAEKLAARLASRQSNTVKVNKLNLNTMGESDIKLPDGQTPSFLAKLKTTVETRRRPLLLGMAAILLALVASQIIGNNDREETTLAEPLYSPDQTTGKEILTGGTASPQKAPITIPEQSIQTPQNIDTPAQKDPAITPEPADKRSQATDTVSQVAQAFSPTPLQQQKPDLHQQRDAVAAVSGSQPIAQTPQGVVAPAHNTQSASLQTGSNDVTGALPKSDQTPLSNVLTTQWPRLNNMKDIGVLPANAGSNKLRKAVLEGDSLAVYELASRLAEGRGAPRDFKLAAKLFEKVANENIAPAQYRIGNMYEKGSGVTRDINLARQWYVKAAENGNAKAMHNLAVLIAEGGGSKPDYTSAVKWFEKAAELGVRDSQYNLAILMARGLGTTQNLSRSYVWFAVAASQGDSDALKKRDEVGARLSPAELATAIGEVERFKPRVLTPLANDISIPAGLYDDKTTIKTPKNERS